MSNAQTKLGIVLTVMLVVAVGVAFGLTGVVSPVFAQQSPVASASNSNPPAATATQPAISNSQPSQSGNIGKGTQSGSTASGATNNGQGQSNGSQRGGFNGGNNGGNGGEGGYNGGNANNGGQGQFNGGGRRGFGRIQLNWQTVATTLNMNQTDLLSKLNNGETLSQIASEQKVDAQTVQDAILSNLKSQLDQAVQNGQVAQAQADELYQRYTTQVQEIMNQPLNGRR